jgi:hypothetical protein
MRVHLDVLGWLHVLVGGSGFVTATSLLILAAGTSAVTPGFGPELHHASPVVRLFVVSAVLLVIGGLTMMAGGRAILARDPRGRRRTLLIALPILLIVPFGTALSIYTFWTLLNDEARKAFGRPPRAPDVAADAGSDESRVD